MEKYGIDNIIKVVGLGLEMGNVADKMITTPGAAKFAALFSLSDEVISLASVDFKLIDDEFKDMSAEEKIKLHEMIKTKFDISNDKLEMAIEGAIGLVLKGEGLIKESISFVKSLKA